MDTVSCNYLRLQQLDCVKIYFFNLNSICDYKLNITSQSGPYLKISRHGQHILPRTSKKNTYFLKCKV